MTLQKLFSDKKRWTKGAFARTNDRRSVSPRSSAAVCWCLLGGANKCYPDRVKRNRVCSDIVVSMRKLFPSFLGSISSFNDWRETGIMKIRAVVKDANV